MPDHPALMEFSLTAGSLFALFTAMAALAAVPSVSVLAVTARSASGGVAHGALTAAGIVLGDIVFLLLAVVGLVLLVEALGPAFVMVKYVGGAYLIWLGVALWRSRSRPAWDDSARGNTPMSSFMTGLLITLGDQKAVFFYLGFLPAFLDLTALTGADMAAVVAVTIAAVGGVKLAYAVAADKASRVVGGGLGRTVNTLAAGVIIAAGVWVILRA